MDDLIQELEQAQEGSRRLDAKIAGAVNIAILMDEDRSHTGPHYTTNLQDALGLVPEGWVINGLKELRGIGWDCTLWATGPAQRVDCGIDEKGNNRSLAPTPALALTIACLKARKEMP